jgi:hypothetical protein
MRPRRKRNAQHLIGGSHFQIDRQLRIDQTGQIVVVDVTSVFAQMRGNAVSPRLHGKLRGAYGIGVRPAARISDRCDVVDIHAKA